MPRAAPPPTSFGDWNIDPLLETSVETPDEMWDRMKKQRQKKRRAEKLAASGAIDDKKPSASNSKVPSAASSSPVPGAAQRAATSSKKASVSNSPAVGSPRFDPASLVNDILKSRNTSRSAQDALPQPVIPVSLTGYPETRRSKSRGNDFAAQLAADLAGVYSPKTSKRDSRGESNSHKSKSKRDSHSQHSDAFSPEDAAAVAELAKLFQIGKPGQELPSDTDSDADDDDEIWGDSDLDSDLDDSDVSSDEPSDDAASEIKPKRHVNAHAHPDNEPSGDKNSRGPQDRRPSSRTVDMNDHISNQKPDATADDLSDRKRATPATDLHSAEPTVKATRRTPTPVPMKALHVQEDISKLAEEIAKRTLASHETPHEQAEEDDDSDWDDEDSDVSQSNISASDDQPRHTNAGNAAAHETPKPTLSAPAPRDIVSATTMPTPVTLTTTTTPAVTGHIPRQQTIVTPVIPLPPPAPPLLTGPTQQELAMQAEIARLQSQMTQMKIEATSSQDVKAIELAKAHSTALEQKDAEILAQQVTIATLQAEVAAVAAVGQRQGTAQREVTSEIEHQYAALQEDYSQAVQQLQMTSRQLDALRHQHSQLNLEHSQMRNDMQEAVMEEVERATTEKKQEVMALEAALESVKQRTREASMLPMSMLNAQSNTLGDDHFDTACQTLFRHVQQWVLRFSKISDGRKCKVLDTIADERLVMRLDNTVLDGSDVDDILGDRVARRDVFMSVVTNMIWEFIFKRYFFGMDREQRQKVKSLESYVKAVASPGAVARWRVTTLTMIAQNPAFRKQVNIDHEAVTTEIFELLSIVLPPPTADRSRLRASLRQVLRSAIDLAVEMRTQLAEYLMLPPAPPEYDDKGESMYKTLVDINTMTERPDSVIDNIELHAMQAHVKIVLFPLVMKQGDDRGEGGDETVIYPAQVVVDRVPGSVIAVPGVIHGTRISNAVGANPNSSIVTASEDMPVT